MTPAIEFESGRVAGGAEFEYIEAHDSEVPLLGLEMEPCEEPHNISLCCARYAVATFASKVLVVDLARARERLLYNHYAASLQSGHSVSQQLLFPEQLTLTEEEYELVEEYAVDFAALGFDIKTQGANTIMVYGIPADVHTEQFDRAIYDLLQSLKLPQSVVELRRNALAQTLAHSEALGSHRFSEEDAERLTVQILATGESYTPSGKRIVAALSTTEIKNLLE